MRCRRWKKNRESTLRVDLDFTTVRKVELSWNYNAIVA
jgi:hypothetical protein